MNSPGGSRYREYMNRRSSKDNQTFVETTSSTARKTDDTYRVKSLALGDNETASHEYEPVPNSYNAYSSPNSYNDYSSPNQGPYIQKNTVKIFSTNLCKFYSLFEIFITRLRKLMTVQNISIWGPNFCQQKSYKDSCFLKMTELTQHGLLRKYHS